MNVLTFFKLQIDQEIQGYFGIPNEIIIVQEVYNGCFMV